MPKNPKNKCENFFVTLNRFFHYTWYLRLSLHAYFYMLIAIFYEFSKDEYSTGEAFSLFIACVTFIYLMIFTLFVIVHFFKYRKRHVTILDRFHVLYDGLRQSSWARFYYSFFLIRRLCLASIIFIDTDRAA